MSDEDDKVLRALEDGDWDDPRLTEATRALIPLYQESDRGAVLVAAAMLDDALERLLRHRLAHDPDIVKNVIDPLFADVGPLSSTAIKEKLARAMGLLDAQAFADLKLLRRLRNKFAHSRDSVKLDESTILSLAHRLTPSEDKLCRVLSLVAAENLPEPLRVPDGLTLTRIRFTMIVNGLRLALERGMVRSGE